MRIKPKTVTLKNGQEVMLRSAEITDAQAMIDHVIATGEETHFLGRTGDDTCMTLEEEEHYLAKTLADEAGFMMVAIIDGELVGSSDIVFIDKRAKERHRCLFGIALRTSVCDLGLGTIMLDEVLAIARTETDFEQVELGVYDDNLRARHIYEKAGFVETGVIPHAFKLEDGTYRDDVRMVLFLR